MPYQLTEIIQRCDKDDVSFFIDTIDSYVNFSDDKGLREVNGMWDGKIKMPATLANKIETEIRYLGSNDAAYVYRKLKGEIPAGVEIDEMIDDVCNVMKIKVKQVCTIESKLEMFCRAMVDKAFFEMGRDKQIELLKKMDVSDETVRKIMEQVNDKKKMLLPVLIALVGQKSAIQIVQAIITALIGVFIGQQAAKVLLANLIAKMPWLASLGPVFIAILTGWTIIDFAGPASRKTIPLMLYLGLICLRDGETEGFWSE